MNGRVAQDVSSAPARRAPHESALAGARPEDTTAEAWHRLTTRWESMTSAQRVALASAMSAAIETAARGGILAEEPDADEGRIRYLLAQRRYGAEIAEAARQAVEQNTSFNLIDDDGLKVDLFVLGNSVLDQHQLVHRQRILVSEDPPLYLWVSSPASQVLRKLEWYQAGGHSRTPARWRLRLDPACRSAPRRCPSPCPCARDTWPGGVGARQSVHARADHHEASAGRQRHGVEHRDGGRVDRLAVHFRRQGPVGERVPLVVLSRVGTGGLRMVSIMAVAPAAQRQVWPPAVGLRTGSAVSAKGGGGGLTLARWHNPNHVTAGV